MPFVKGGKPSEPLPLMELFMRRVTKTDYCWLWTGSKTRGYGYFEFRDRQTGKMRRVRANRWLYEQMIGPIPKGKVLDHRVCDNPPCVRPDHQEPATQRQNILRGKGLAAQNAAKTHCPRDHPYSGDNLIITSNGGRACRTCENKRCREYYYRMKGKTR